MKVLILLDDIDHGDHLEYLAGDLGWFGNGSRVIVTTGNRHLIDKDHAIYELPTLPDLEAMQLFNKHAFKNEVPDERFKKFSLEVVNHAKGLPLALKREEKKLVMQILESCDFGAEHELNVLIDKSLVFVSKNNLIKMHDLIQDMGRYVVRMQKDSGEQSRLWDVEDIEKVMVNNTYLPSLQKLNLSYSERLMQTPDFTGMPNLEYLDLSNCSNLEELEIKMSCSGLREIPSSIIEQRTLKMSSMQNLVCLPSSICKLKGLVKLNLWACSKLESLPEELDGGLPEDVGSLSSLEMLNISGNNFEHFPRSMVQLGALQYLDLSYCKRLKELPGFMGMQNLEILDLSHFNLIDGGLVKDIGCLSSLKVLDLSGNNFEHLPQRIAQLGALQNLDLSDCKRLTQLQEFPQQLDTIRADWSNHLICNSLFQNISTLQNDISDSHSLSLRVFTSCANNIPSWFHHQGMDTRVSISQYA
ncbi:hypothetical protein KY290_000650 [Solanum tuberosum]|uniref:Disease resistance protein Roq1-like winged-helix domain-containing protein n=1 Tax=Solanum tuberosum TaxID=4113 RepID=A0ABQ7WM60_SOLTU|nr:hypothetical protein KY289_000715 [Solanum tuberosum]KAH0781052.1 hypothetical protein KY290_000650 [Solanum tuberosum]